MIRLLLRLCGIKDFEICQSCETLKQQLSYERDEKQRLTDTLLSIISPKVIEQPTVELQPVIQTAGLFSRRRAALEEKDRQEAKVLRNSTNLGKPDDRLKDTTIDRRIEELENELGVSEQKEA